VSRPRVPFQYAVLRLVPRVDRGECLNVGVVLFARTRAHLALHTALDVPRVRALAPALDVEALARRLAGLEAIAEGRDGFGPIARLPQHERFHWLTAPSSTIIQPSAIHTGLCADPVETAADLLRRLVLPPVG
jgi:hypothetical protein